MPGRHEFVPTHILPFSDGEDVSSYDYVTQLRDHHAAAIAGWNEKPGLHKQPTQPEQAFQTVRSLGQVLLSRIPITIVR